MPRLGERYVALRGGLLGGDVRLPRHVIANICELAMPMFKPIDLSAVRRLRPYGTPEGGRVLSVMDDYRSRDRFVDWIWQWLWGLPPKLRELRAGYIWIRMHCDRVPYGPWRECGCVPSVPLEEVPLSRGPHFDRCPEFRRFTATASSPASAVGTKRTR